MFRKDRRKADEADTRSLAAGGDVAAGGNSVPEIVKVNASLIEALIPADLRRLVNHGHNESAGIILEWVSRKGIVSVDVGVRSYQLSYVPDDIDGTQWAQTGSMHQLENLRAKLTPILPVHDSERVKLATVLLFLPTGRFVGEESWSVPDGASGPWSMEQSVDFHRMSGGPVLVETQEPWGFPHLSIAD